VRGRIEKMKEEVVGDPEMNINIKRKAKNQAIDIVLTSLTENNNKL
jgi:hypothetical protein